MLTTNSAIIDASAFSLSGVLHSRENGKELFPMNNLISRFRANIITNGTRAFEEEKWDVNFSWFLAFPGKFREVLLSFLKSCQWELTSTLGWDSSR